MAETYGEPLWCVGTGYRNTHLRAIAPTVSNSKLSGNVSPGIEPWAANVFTEQSAKGTFIRKNPTLESVLEDVGLNNEEIWDKILEDGGSVQGIERLDDILMGDHDIPAKEVFRTFKEINQLELVNQAGLRQQYVDQSVSLNLAFPSEATPKWLNKVHFEAWKKGVKTLYYTRTEAVLRGDIAQQAMSYQQFIQPLLADLTNFVSQATNCDSNVFAHLPKTSPKKRFAKRTKKAPYKKSSYKKSPAVN